MLTRITLNSALSLVLLATAGLFSPPTLAQAEFRQENCELGAVRHKNMGKYVFDSLKYLLIHSDPESKQRTKLLDEISENKDKYRDLIYSENKNYESRERRELETSNFSHGQKGVLLAQQRVTHVIVTLTIEISFIISARMARNPRITEFDETRFLRMVISECLTSGANR